MKRKACGRSPARCVLIALLLGRDGQMIHDVLEEIAGLKMQRVIALGKRRKHDPESVGARGSVNPGGAVLADNGPEEITVVQRIVELCLRPIGAQPLQRETV